MKINHVIIGATNAITSADFYCGLLNFTKTDDDAGAVGGLVLYGLEDTQLLLIPKKKEYLPNPLHVAFECKSVAEFDETYKTAIKMNLKPTQESSEHSPPGHGQFTRAGKTFMQFYVSDPDGVKIEVMVYV